MDINPTVLENLGKVSITFPEFADGHYFTADNSQWQIQLTALLATLIIPSPAPKSIKN